MVREKDCFGIADSDIARYFTRATASRIPLAASFELTRRCNFRCVHCYLGDQKSIRRHQYRELDKDTIFRLFDEMVESGTLFLLLTGGDPMLRTDFVEIYKYAVRAGLLVTVFCNGSLVTDEIVRAFVEYPPRILEITVYGATQETFEAVTQQPGSFSACIAGIERLQKAGIRVRLKTMVLTLNVDEFSAIRQLAEDMGLQFRHDCSLHAAVAHEDNGGCSNICDSEGSLSDTLQYRVLPEQAAAVDLSIDKLALELVEAAEKTCPSEATYQLYYCGAGKSSYHVTPYGGLQPCLIVRTHSVNICDTGGLQGGWDGVLQNFTSCRASSSFSCNNCRSKNVCTACPAVFATMSGNPEQVDTFFCQYAKKRSEKKELKRVIWARTEERA
ncbi:radical SAM/SPASM domain-containing protein [Candidatus Electrothrix sp.]|uniref:radical SAM/SPASM domain-containing protein n=1 Tax=Candidatus Electrothrix sp. TaxID=2170559 RepID=UPI004056ECFC